MQRAAGHGAIPAGWHRVRLRELLALEQPGAWGEDPTPEERGVKVLRAADLTRDGRVNPSNAAWRRLSNRDMERRLMCDGDLILERSGGGPGNPVGRVALIENLGAVYCNNFCQQLRVDELACTSKYMARALWHRYTQGVTARLEHQTTGIRNLDYAAYLDLPILLPPLPEQRVIAAVLDSIDGAIEGAEAVIAATGQLRDSLLHDLLTRGLPGQHTEWRDVPGLGSIPADWEVVRLGEIAEVIMGQSPPGLNCNRDGDGIPLLNGPTEYGPNHPEPAQWTTDARKISQEGDVLFCVRGATAGRMNWADRDYAIGRGVAAIRHKSGTSFQRYLRALLDFRMPELLSVVTGSTFPNLSYEQITQLRVPGIPSVQQQAIAAVLDGVDAANEVARDELARLRLLKESTAEALLTGRVRI